MAAAGGHWLKIAQGDIGKLVFVPKGQGAAEVITGQVPTGAAWPDSVSDVKVIKGLGGSTGAKLVQDENGNLYVMKTGANEGHIREESAADTAYQALGADVPEHRLYMTPNGPVKLARFVEGKTLAQVEGSEPDSVVAGMKVALKKNFAADALLGNWDVIGLDKDNVMLGSNGKAYRIDNGGALRYRAMGGKKAEWGANVTEVFTMRTSSQGSSVFGDMSFSTIVTQSSALLGKRTALLNALPSDLKGLMGKRLDSLEFMVTTFNKLTAGGMSAKTAESVIADEWGL